MNPEAILGARGKRAVIVDLPWKKPCWKDRGEIRMSEREVKEKSKEGDTFQSQMPEVKVGQTVRA